MSDRFDLEQDILRVWDVTKDLDTANKLVLDGAEPLTEDEISNIIMGIEQTLDLRCRGLWDTFCKVYELDGYRRYLNTEESFSVGGSKKEYRKMKQEIA
jgi:hypothetical protein